MASDPSHFAAIRAVEYVDRLMAPDCPTDPWPYVLDTREAAVVVAALRAFQDQPGGATALADRIYAEQQRHIVATLARDPAS